MNAADRECEQCSQLIDERDRAHDAADELALAIVRFFGDGDDIGEHSNFNCPWKNALELIERRGNWQRGDV